MGLVTVPAAMVAREIAAGSLERLSDAGTPESMDVYARYDAQKASGFVATAAALAADAARAFNETNPAKDH